MKEKIKSAIEKIKKTKEIIQFAYQLSYSIESASIKPENIISELLITGKEDLHIQRDWSKYPHSLKNDFANTTKINIISFQIIVCKEIYSSLFIKYGLKWAERDTNSDLYAAQEILRHIRNALGHFKSLPLELEAYGVWDFTDQKGKIINLGKLEIKSINVVLDATNLHGVVFAWNHIGGIKNFIKILDYLEDDLSRRI